MQLTIVDHPQVTALTTLARLHRELGLTDTSQDDRLTDLIEEISAEVIRYLGQPLLRQSVTELQVGYGRTVQALHVTPLVQITEVRQRDAVLPADSYRISDAEAGFVYRAARWDDTRPSNQWIERDPAIMPGSADFAFDYLGGYLMPGDNVTLSGECTVTASTSTFELTGTGAVLPLLGSGDSIVVAGFAEAANNGRFRVRERTVTTLQVEGALTDEALTGAATIQVQTLPRDLEGAVVREVKTRYLSQRRDLTVTSERLGDWQATYGQGRFAMDADPGGFTATVAKALTKYMRID